MKNLIEKRRNLLPAGAATLLTSGCARYARYQAEAAKYAQRAKNDAQIAQSSKTITVLAPETDRRLNFRVAGPWFSRLPTWMHQGQTSHVPGGNAAGT